MESRLRFKSGSLQLEGLLDPSDSDRGVVIAHPHPLYGGSMYNPVVEALKKTYRAKGYTTLRFNFRGTGNSQGGFDNGQGERIDVCSAIAALKERGIEQIDLAGYSFGAWVNAHVTPDRAAYNRMVMVSPPIGFIDFDAGLHLPALHLVVTGSLDDIAPVSMIEKALPAWSGTARFEIIDGADHFYSGHLNALQAVLDERL